MEFDKKVIVDVDGVIETGKQFDLDLRLPEDDRNVVYGIIKDHKGKPVVDAVVKLVEVCKDERKPVSHTFTDKEGEFVFGPLCPHKSYAIEIWVDRVKHVKICKICEHEGKCLKGIEIECKPHFMDDEKKCEKEHEKDYGKEYEKEYEKECKKECEKDYGKSYEKECKKECEKECKKEY